MKGLLGPKAMDSMQHSQFVEYNVETPTFGMIRHHTLSWKHGGEVAVGALFTSDLSFLLKRCNSKAEKERLFGEAMSPFAEGAIASEHATVLVGFPVPRNWHCKAAEVSNRRATNGGRRPPIQMRHALDSDSGFYPSGILSATASTPVAQLWSNSVVIERASIQNVLDVVESDTLALFADILRSRDVYFVYATPRARRKRHNQSEEVCDLRCMFVVIPVRTGRVESLAWFWTQATASLISGWRVLRECRSLPAQTSRIQERMSRLLQHTECISGASPNPQKQQHRKASNMQQTEYTNETAIHDTIGVTGLRIPAMLGTKEWEKIGKQDVIVDFSMKIDTSKVRKSDLLAETLNIGRAVKAIEKYLAKTSHNLIESLAHEIARILVIELGSSQVEVCVKKPGAFRNADCEFVKITRGGRDFE